MAASDGCGCSGGRRKTNGRVRAEIAGTSSPAFFAFPALDVNLMKLGDLNSLGEAAAAQELLRCCGSPRWAQAMAAARPFDSADALYRKADECWRSLETRDILDAFAAHPRIGQVGGPGEAGQPGQAALARGVRQPGEHTDWAAEEQAGTRRASDDIQERLARGNRAYEARFGYIFIICATGKSAAEMLASLEARLRHAAVEELRIAAEEQRQITRLRLAKLVDGRQDTP